MPPSVPPLVLVTGPETLLAERAVAGVLAELHESEPDIDVVRVSACLLYTSDAADE